MIRTESFGDDTAARSSPVLGSWNLEGRLPFQQRGVECNGGGELGGADEDAGVGLQNHGRLFELCDQKLIDVI